MTELITWKDIKYFKPEEFDSPDIPGTGLLNISLELVKKLDEGREITGIPWIVTSGFRTYAHNKKINGKPNSAHLRGFAADILADTSITRYKILGAAFLLGFKRIEVAPKHIHLDIDLNLPQKVCDFLPSYDLSK